MNTFASKASIVRQVIDKQDEPWKMKELIDLVQTFDTAIDRPSIAVEVSTLFKRGYLTREKDTDNWFLYSRTEKEIDITSRPRQNRTTLCFVCGETNRENFYDTHNKICMSCVALRRGLQKSKGVIRLIDVRLTDEEAIDFQKMMEVNLDFYKPTGFMRRVYDIISRQLILKAKEKNEKRDEKNSH